MFKKKSVGAQAPSTSSEVSMVSGIEDAVEPDGGVVDAASEDEQAFETQIADWADGLAEGHNDRVKFHAERVKDAVATFLATKAEWDRLETIER